MSSDPSDPLSAAPEPEIRHRAGISLVWLVPLVVALVASWLVYNTLSERGPQITVAFRTAEGIEAGKTKVRYKNIEVGIVDSVRFSDDFSHVVLHVQMVKNAEAFLGRGAKFWVVRPHLSLRGVSGLSTLVSGAYIEIEPGRGSRQRHFDGLETPPVIKAEEAGVQVNLITRDLGSLDAGSPVYYHGILAGEVLGHELGNDQKSVLVYAFVRAPFDQLVRSNSRFWNISGVDVDVSSEGLSVRTESIEAVMFGGLSFDTPDTTEPNKDNLAGVIFTVHENRETVDEDIFTQRIRFVLYFDGSVRGLNIGAPVEFKGIKIGQVTDVRLEYDPTDTSFRIPVLIEIEPQRVVTQRASGTTTPYAMLQTLVDRGLRARLQTGSLLTGQLFVELDMHPQTSINLVNAKAPYPELPTIPASLAEIERSVKSFLSKLEKLDLETISSELIGTLQSADALLGSEEVGATITDLRASVGALRKVLGKVDRRVEPLTDNLNEAAIAGRDALNRLQVTLGLMNDVLKSDSPLQYRAIEMAEELTETARSVRTFVDLLERNPDAVLFGKPRPGAQ
ncbi:MAG: paraquat-inducible protein B [Gammaproteobacteria bacterium]|jgi:paraquat-inducible protein B